MTEDKPVFKMRARCLEWHKHNKTSIQMTQSILCSLDLIFDPELQYAVSTLRPTFPATRHSSLRDLCMVFWGAAARVPQVGKASCARPHTSN